MVIAGVLMLADEAAAEPLAAELVGMGLQVRVPAVGVQQADLPAVLADARRVAAVAIWLRSNEVPGPLVVLARGEAARLLPALALSQRAAGRLVTGYVLVNAPSPAPSMDWPDAPVWWVATDVAQSGTADGALSARLRGFEVVELPERDEVAARPLARVVARVAGAVPRHDH